MPNEIPNDYSDRKYALELINKGADFWECD